MNLENLNILCWNVRGLGDPSKYYVVKETIRSANAVIFCLQEIKLNSISLNKFYSFAPPYFHQFTSKTAIESRGGTIIAWQPTLTPEHTYTLTYSTTVVFKNNLGFEFMITNVYGVTNNACNSTSYKN
jgi:exonuclease III